MKPKLFHYTECGLSNIYLMNGYDICETPHGLAVSIKDIDGLHKAIGRFLISSKKDFSGEEIRFIRLEMLMSQSMLAFLLGVSEQSVRRWENDKINIPKPSESLLRLLCREKIFNQQGKISTILKEFAALEEQMNNDKIVFQDTTKGWQASA